MHISLARVIPKYTIHHDNLKRLESIVFKDMINVYELLPVLKTILPFLLERWPFELETEADRNYSE